MNEQRTFGTVAARLVVIVTDIANVAVHACHAGANQFAGPAVAAVGRNESACLSGYGGGNRITTAAPAHRRSGACGHRHNGSQRCPCSAGRRACRNPPCRRCCRRSFVRRHRGGTGTSLRGSYRPSRHQHQDTSSTYPSTRRRMPLPELPALEKGSSPTRARRVYATRSSLVVVPREIAGVATDDDAGAQAAALKLAEEILKPFAEAYSDLVEERMGRE